MSNKVSSVKCESYDLQEVYAALKEAIKKIDFQLPFNKKVLIKPNIMSQNKPDQHSITHYSIVEVLCQLLKENNCRILIGDSIAFYQKGLTRKAFETSKIKEVAIKYGAKIIPFDEEKLVKVSINNSVLNELYIPECILEADMVINACKLKTHGGMRLSGALKNMFGCLPGGYKQLIHMWSKNDYELSDIMLDIHKIIKPAISVMDAVISLDGGPSAIGKPVRTSRILASVNAGSLDLAACMIMGYEPNHIPLLICAKNRSMISDFDDIELQGDFIPTHFKKLVKGDILEQYGKPGIFVKHTYVSPTVRNSKCINCGICQKFCTVGAFIIKENEVAIDHQRCIKCYGCLHICPVKAITIKSSNINKFIRIMRYVLDI